MNAIETKDLTKRFKERTAVDSLSLTVEQGEIFALLGQNGAGKSTTIRMLSCLTAPTSGDAFVFGHSVVSDEQNVKKIINVSPQETAVAPKLSVRENLELTARLYGLDKKTAREKTEEMLRDFSLLDRASERAKKLSGGMQRKLSLAMALISEPKVLFLDEPTVGLDVRARRELWKLIESLKGSMTILLTTHYLEEAEALSDRMVIMNGGKATALGTADDIKEVAGTDDFEEAFLRLTEEGRA